MREPPGGGLLGNIPEKDGVSGASRVPRWGHGEGLATAAKQRVVSVYVLKTNSFSRAVLRTNRVSIGLAQGYCHCRALLVRGLLCVANRGDKTTKIQNCYPMMIVSYFLQVQSCYCSQ